MKTSLAWGALTCSGIEHTFDRGAFEDTFRSELLKISPFVDAMSYKFPKSFWEWRDGPAGRFPAGRICHEPLQLEAAEVALGMPRRFRGSDFPLGLRSKSCLSL